MVMMSNPWSLKDSYCRQGRDRCGSGVVPFTSGIVVSIPFFNWTNKFKTSHGKCKQVRIARRVLSRDQTSLKFEDFQSWVGYMADFFTPNVLNSLSEKDRESVSLYHHNLVRRTAILGVLFQCSCISSMVSTKECRTKSLVIFKFFIIF
jgi:hypothetical protein